MAESRRSQVMTTWSSSGLRTRASRSVFHPASALGRRRLPAAPHRVPGTTPGIQEYVFFELSNHAVAGGSIDAVQRWFGAKVGDLQDMGYRLNARRVAEPTPTILEWVKEGRGFRGALIPTNFRKLHPAESEDVMHAVAVSVDRLEPGADEQLVMVDPWPGVANGARDKVAVPPILESAHRDYKFNAIIFYWAGWS
jgi:hypothetical protein